MSCIYKLHGKKINLLRRILYPSRVLDYNVPSLYHANIAYALRYLRVAVCWNINVLPFAASELVLAGTPTFSPFASSTLLLHHHIIEQPLSLFSSVFPPHDSSSSALSLALRKWIDCLIGIVLRGYGRRGYPSRRFLYILVSQALVA